MIDIFQLKAVLEDLICENKNLDLARRTLEHYEEKATTVEEYEIISELCSKVNHHSLRLKCLQYAYTHCINSEKLSLYRYELAKTYLLLNQPEKSLFYNDIDLKTSENFYTLIERANFLNALGNNEKADLIIESLCPDNIEEKNDLSILIAKRQLRNGDLDIGVKNATFPEKSLYLNLVPYSFWIGVKKPGKRIIVHGRGDIGDQFSHFRFINKLKEFEMQPIFYSAYVEKRSDIVEIYRRHGVEAIDNTNLFTSDDLWVNLSALPGYFQLEEETLWEGPYLTARKDPKNKIISSKMLKIGIKLKSDSDKNNGYTRDIPFEQLYDHLPKNVLIYNFDKEHHRDCLNVRDNITNWDDTLDYIDQMDVIISCDTSVAHAAGAMGKNTIVLAPLDPGYIWISNREDGTTPWYGPNLRILKQSSVRNWEQPLQKLKSTIKELVK